MSVAVHRVWSTGNGWNLSEAFSGKEIRLIIHVVNDNVDVFSLSVCVYNIFRAQKHCGGTDTVMVTAMSQTCWSKDVIVTLSMSAVTYVPGQRLEFPLWIQIRFQGRKWFPGQTSASMWLRKTWGTCGLSVKCVYWSLSFVLWRSGEAESARGASDSERAHSLLLHLHFMFSLTTPWPEGGNKPCFQRTAMWYRPHSCFNTHTHCTLFSLD